MRCKRRQEIAGLYLLDKPLKLISNQLTPKSQVLSSISIIQLGSE